MTTEQRQKVTEDGQPVFLLPQADLEVIIDVPKRVTTTIETADPVMVSSTVPHLGADGNQMEYEVTIPEEQQDGSTVQVGTGQWVKCWENVLVQEQDAKGNLLYWNTIAVQETRSEAQPALEITSEDPAWTEDLLPAYELVEVPDPKPSLEDALASKLAELEAARDRTIYSTFTSTALGELKTYNYDKEASDNFKAKAALLGVADLITTIMWATIEDGFVPHTRSEFIQVLVDGGAHEENAKMQYYMKAEEVKAAYEAGNVDGILSVVW